MALTSWNDILNKPNGIDEVPEIALTVEQLSASVLSIGEDVQELKLSVADLSASVLSISEDVAILENKKITVTELIHSYDVTSTSSELTCAWEGYDLLIINLCFYGNIYGSVTVPVSYFSTTGSGKAVFIQNDTKILSVYKSSNAGKIMAALTNGAANWGIDVQGIKLATPTQATRQTKKTTKKK